MYFFICHLIRRVHSSAPNLVCMVSSLSLSLPGCKFLFLATSLTDFRSPIKHLEQTLICSLSGLLFLKTFSNFFKPLLLTNYFYPVFGQQLNSTVQFALNTANYAIWLQRWVLPDKASSRTNSVLARRFTRPKLDKTLASQMNHLRCHQTIQLLAFWTVQLRRELKKLLERAKRFFVSLFERRLEPND